MSLLPLYFDVVSKQLVFSETNPRTFRLPDLNEEDKLGIEFRALKKVRESVAPFYERMSLAGAFLGIYVGSANAILASNESWTIGGSNDLLTGTLDLATAGISALADGTTKTFEIKLVIGEARHRGDFSVTIRKSVSIAASLNPVVNDTALGTLEADRVYMRKEMRPGEGILLPSEDGLSRGFLYWHNDGSLRGEAVT
jgi:hypothetical protein